MSEIQIKPSIGEVTPTEKSQNNNEDLVKLKETMFAGMRKLNDKIEALKSNLIQNPTNAYHSEKMGALALALSKAQGEFDVALNGKKVDVGSYSYYYAELLDLIKASKKALCKNELAITQDIIPDPSGKKALLTILLHSSDQWVKSYIVLDADPAKNRSKDQAEGGSITFWKRYAYSSIIGLASADEADLNLFQEEDEKPATTKTSFEKNKETFNNLINKSKGPGGI